MTRHFSFWCESCPTRVLVETEVSAASCYPDPEYVGAMDGVATARIRPPVEHDDGLEIADLCPADGGQLHCLDELIGRGLIPHHDDIDSPNLHAGWIEKRKASA